MRHLVVKDQNRRRRFAKVEMERRILEGLARLVGGYPHSSSALRGLVGGVGNVGGYPRNRCLVTRRSRFVLRMFGLERRVLRDKFRDGFLPAIRRILW